MTALASILVSDGPAASSRVERRILINEAPLSMSTAWLDAGHSLCATNPKSLLRAHHMPCGLSEGGHAGPLGRADQAVSGINIFETREPSSPLGSNNSASSSVHPR